MQLYRRCEEHANDGTTDGIEQCVDASRPTPYPGTALQDDEVYGWILLRWVESRKYSVGTVIRSYLIEHEIAIGMQKLFFEGGTPHSMRHSFLSEEAMDIVVMNRSLPVFLLRNIARWLRPEKNFLLQTLMSPAVKWQLR